MWFSDGFGMFCATVVLRKGIEIGFRIVSIDNNFCYAAYDILDMNNYFRSNAKRMY